VDLSRNGVLLSVRCLLAVMTAAGQNRLFGASDICRLAGPVPANTHLNNHPDTTSVSGSATNDSPGGPIWAYDVTVAPGEVPDPAALPGQSPSDAHISDNIRTLFDGNVVSIAQAGGYTFTYHQVAGADYTQVG
jgi:hypothetical protein